MTKVLLSILLLLNSFFYQILTKHLQCTRHCTMQCDPPVKEAGGIRVWVWGWRIWGGEVNRGASKCIKCQGMSDKCRDEKWIRVRWKVIILTRVIREVLSEEVASELRSEWTKAWTILGSEEELDNQWEQQRQWPRVRSEELYLKKEQKTRIFGSEWAR